MRYQIATEHKDPIHVTAHYLKAVSSTSPFEVHVQTLKKGRGLTNVLANLVQEGQVRIMTHIIFGILAPTPTGPDVASSVTRKFNAPGAYARRHPLSTHPATAEVSKRMRSAWSYRDVVKKAEDPVFTNRNQVDHPSRTNGSTVGGGGIEWGSWFELLGDETRITTPSIAFLCDIFTNAPTLLPKEERKGLEASWFPTITLAIELKHPIPTSGSYASRTVGIYHKGDFMNAPQGRHDAYVEIWTAPSNIGEGKEVDGWREEQVCLAISTQMALVVSMDVNARTASAAKL